MNVQQTHIHVEGDAPALPQTPPKAIEHYLPVTFSDKFAMAATKVLRGVADLCFRQHYMHRAIVLETVAAVPGMVGAMLQHLRSLRIMRGRPDMIKLLLDEAENERMHLMTFVTLCKPNLLERMIILIAQGCFFNGFFLLYLVAPACAHRLVGYFEEEAVYSYTCFIEAIDAGKITNGDIPSFAREYWHLSADAKLRELVIAIRNDEAGHRDVNHQLSNIEATLPAAV